MPVMGSCSQHDVDLPTASTEHQYRENTETHPQGSRVGECGASWMGAGSHLHLESTANHQTQRTGANETLQKKGSCAIYRLMNHTPQSQRDQNKACLVVLYSPTTNIHWIYLYTSKHENRFNDTHRLENTTVSREHYSG